MSIKVSQVPGGARFSVKVVPGASRDRIVGVLGNALKIAVRKPPEAGAANAAVIQLLARSLKVSQRDVRITRGHTQPRKEVEICGISAQELLFRLDAFDK